MRFCLSNRKGKMNEDLGLSPEVHPPLEIAVFVLRAWLNHWFATGQRLLELFTVIVLRIRSHGIHHEFFTIMWEKTVWTLFKHRTVANLRNGILHTDGTSHHLLIFIVTCIVCQGSCNLRKWFPLRNYWRLLKSIFLFFELVNSITIKLGFVF